MNASSVTWQSWSEKWGHWNAWYSRPSIEAKASNDLLTMQTIHPAGMIYETASGALLSQVTPRVTSLRELAIKNIHVLRFD